MNSIVKIMMIMGMTGLVAGTLLAEPLKSSEITNGVAPGFVLRDLAGNYVMLSDICYPGEDQPRKPRCVIVLNFMSVDCGPCKQEMPLFLKVTREFKEQGVKAFVISTDPFSKQEALSKLVADLGIDCTVLIDPYKTACTKFGVTGIPHIFVLARDRRIVQEFNGATDNFEGTLRAAIQKALAGK